MRVRRLGFALLLLLFGCAPRTSHVLTAQDSGKTIELRPGETIQVVLEGNPTTGYTWEVSPESDAPVEAVGDWEFQPSSRALGAGGQLRLTLKAGRGGQGLLRLVYHRPFEAGTPPLATFEVTIVIK